MRRVELTGPTVFRARGSVHVNDKNGLPFYVFQRPGDFTFTLPAGTYTLSNGSMVGRLRGNPPAMPSRLRFPLPKKITMRVSANGSKCSIDLVRGIIYIDPSLLALPSYCLTFVLFHEIGHYFFKGAPLFPKGEQECDRFAAEQMLARGFNPSQIADASRRTLSARNAERVQCVDHYARSIPSVQ